MGLFHRVPTRDKLAETSPGRGRGSSVESHKMQKIKFTVLEVRPIMS